VSSKPLLATLAVLALAGGAAAFFLVWEQGLDEPPAGSVRAAFGQWEIEGVPQVGSKLGEDSDDVPTLTVFAVVGSPGYARFDRAVLPALLDRHVRTGRVRIQLRTLPGDGRAPEIARSAQAAGLQTRLWNYVRAFVALGDGPAAERAVAGLDPARLATERGSERVSDAIARAVRMAEDAGVDATPAFTLTNGSRTEPFSAPLRSGPFSAALARSLRDD
jgi:hypothetical protein